MQEKNRLELMHPGMRRGIKEHIACLEAQIDKLDIDLGAAVEEKMILNRAKYPADLVRGDARKYDEYKR